MLEKEDKGERLTKNEKRRMKRVKKKDVSGGFVEQT